MFSERKFSPTKVLPSTVYAYASCCDKIASEHFAYNTSLVHNYMHVCTIIYMYVYVHTRTQVTHTHKTYTLTAQYGSQRQRSARVPPVFTTMINLSSDKPTHTVFVHRASLRCYPSKGLQNVRRGTRLVYVCPLVPSILWLACRIQPCDCHQCYIANYPPERRC